MHADQTHGINDLRVFFLKNEKKNSIYTDLNTRKYLLKSFGYCFKKHYDYPPTLELLNIKKKILIDNSISIESVKVGHGNINSLSFVINKKIAYLPDANKIYDKDIKIFKNLDYLIIDCLRYKKHPSHFNLDDILRINKLLNSKKVILTNLHSDLDYDKLSDILPNNIKPAYDGLTLNI